MGLTNEYTQTHTRTQIPFESEFQLDPYPIRIRIDFFSSSSLLQLLLFALFSCLHHIFHRSEGSIVRFPANSFLLLFSRYFYCFGFGYGINPRNYDPISVFVCLCAGSLVYVLCTCVCLSVRVIIVQDSLPI